MYIRRAGDRDEDSEAKVLMCEELCEVICVYVKVRVKVLGIYTY